MNLNGFIDQPCVQAMEYFSGVMAKGYSWATKLAFFFGLLGVIWTGIRIAISKQQIKEGLWDLMTRWLIFIMVMTFYPTIVTGVSYISNTMGKTAGGGMTNVEKQLRVLYDELTALTRDQERASLKLAKDLEEQLNITVEDYNPNEESYEEFIKKVDSTIKGATKWRSDERTKAKALLDKYKTVDDTAIVNYGAANKKLIAALEDILIMKNPDGTKYEGIDMAKNYTGMNLWLKSSDGSNTCFISPAALLRIAILEASILWAQTNYQYVETDANEDGYVLEKVDARGFEKWSGDRIAKKLLAGFCCICLIVATCMADIQYVMTIIEYTIISGIAALFLPLLLFEGTKDIPKKFVSVFTSFFVKMLVITICMFFCFNLMIDIITNEINDPSDWDFVKAANIIFNILLLFVLTQNAPKIAQTILTGQPQLSMGEFVTAAGTAGGVAAFSAKAGMGAAKFGGKAAGAAGMTLAGGAAAAVASGSKAVKQFQEAAHTGGRNLSEGAIKAGSIAAGVGAGLKSFAKQGIANPIKGAMGGIGNSIASKGNDFLHNSGGGGKSQMLSKLTHGVLGGGGSSGGGGGSSASGQNPHSGYINNNSFKNAGHLDERGNKVNATAKEYLGNAYNKGRSENTSHGVLKLANSLQNYENKQRAKRDISGNLTGHTRNN